MMENGLHHSTPRRALPLPRSATYRLVSGLLALSGLAILITAATVTPDPAGTGTHRQLHLRSCGFYQRHGYPCPTCGMTTAFAHVVRGHIGGALAVQPAGTIAAALCIAATAAAAYAAFTGRRLDRHLLYLYANRITIALIATLLLLVNWLWLCLPAFLGRT